jgi:hypothetical protein
MPTVTNYCDEEEWPQNSSQNLYKYTWCTTLSYSHAFHNSYHLRANFPNYKGPDPRYKWVGKSLTCNKHVGFKSLCSKQVRFKALVISKSFSSLLIGCVRRPTPRTGAYYFLSVVKSKKIHGFNNNFLICNTSRCNGSFSEFNTASHLVVCWLVASVILRPAQTKGVRV